MHQKKITFQSVYCVKHLHESCVKLKPVSPVLLPGANRCPPPASMAVRCGDMPKSESTQASSYDTRDMSTQPFVIDIKAS